MNGVRRPIPCQTGFSLQFCLNEAFVSAFNSSVTFVVWRFGGLVCVLC